MGAYKRNVLPLNGQGCLHIQWLPISRVRTYLNLPIKRPWALEIHGPKMGVGVYTGKRFVRITHIHTGHRIIKKRVGAYTEMGAYSGEYGTIPYTLPYMYVHQGGS